MIIPKRVTVIRTAMIGGGLSYDVYVKVSDAPSFVGDSGKYRHCVTHIGRDSYRNGKHSYFLNFSEATCPESHYEMPHGWDRYENWKAHDKQARRLALDLAERAFPELAKYRKQGHDSIPTLWVNNLLAPAKESDAETEIPCP